VFIQVAAESLACQTPVVAFDHSGTTDIVSLCGSQPNLQRQVIADMLRDWDKRYPGRIETMFSAMQNVVPSHLSDINLFDFKGITHGSEVVDGGDLAFDREEIPMQPAGWQPEEDDVKLDEMRLNVLEVK
jgi:tRNA 2-thiocytidine biosynthesis protein TtcA